MTNAVGLVTLFLAVDNPSTYFRTKRSVTGYTIDKETTDLGVKLECSSVLDGGSIRPLWHMYGLAEPSIEYRLTQQGQHAMAS
jgi:hypothetical protein